jgi:alpha-tubulin suppressor-like RCC1 family protein
VVDVAATNKRTCACKNDGSVWCWGLDGKNGDGSAKYEPTPVLTSGLGPKVVDLALGYGHLCALNSDGTVWCRGSNSYGQLGDGTVVNNAGVQVAALGATVTQVEAGWSHTCARKSDSTLWCWGDNDNGQVGDGTTDTPKSLPVQVIALGASVVGVVGGGAHTCARKSDASLWCWGTGGLGQLGIGSTPETQPTPVQAVGLALGVAKTAAGENHTCAQATDGTLWCWGYNTDGEVGNGTTGLTAPTPVFVTSLNADVVDVAAGFVHTCARKSDGSIWCWGQNVSGQLGDGTIDSPKLSPVQASLDACP